MSHSHLEEQTFQQADMWVEEKFKNFYGMRYRIEKILFSQRSEFQHVNVVETVGHGRMLLNDGLVMTSDRDEFVYHEMMAHVPLYTHPNPKRVLIIGGGDGGTAREVLRHQGVDECWMVEIDPVVLQAAREFLPQMSCSLDHKKMNLVVGDGVKFVAETDLKFDVVLIDSTDPFGPAAPLFGQEFYTNVRKVLNPNGIVVAQGETPFYALEIQKEMLKMVSPMFEKLRVYNFSNLTYPGGLWSFMFASLGPCPVVDFRDERVLQSGLNFKYYNPGIHRASFHLPQFMVDAYAQFMTALPNE